jgi:hypothetical protein
MPTPDILSAAHGTNWAEVGVILGAVGFLVTGAAAYLNSRLNGQDDKIEVIDRVTADTRVSVARIEGYLARSNGGGKTATQLPDLDHPVIVSPERQVYMEEK